MTVIEISGRRIGANYPPFIIAEVGINHDGDFDKAIKIQPRNKDAYYYRGHSQMALGNWKTAINDFDKTLIILF